MKPQTQSNSEQPLLLESSAEEEGSLFSASERRKRHTAAQVEKLEWRRQAILMLLATGWPARRIKERLQCNADTVVALAKQSAEKVGALNLEFAEILVRTAAGFFGINATKAHDAPSEYLILGAGIAFTHASELKTMGLIPEKEAGSIKEDRVAAAARLHAAMTEELARQLEEPASPASPTPQPVVSCGVKAGEGSDITLSPKPQTTTPPAWKLRKCLVLGTKRNGYCDA
jgi:hypothetical protein